MKWAETSDDGVLLQTLNIKLGCIHIMSHLLSFFFCTVCSNFKSDPSDFFAFTPTTHVHRPRNGNKLAPNNGSKQNFAIDADKNKILI